MSSSASGGQASVVLDLTLGFLCLVGDSEGLHLTSVCDKERGLRHKNKYLIDV